MSRQYRCRRTVLQDVKTATGHCRTSNISASCGGDRRPAALMWPSWLTVDRTKLYIYSKNSNNITRNSVMQRSAASCGHWTAELTKLTGQSSTEALVIWGRRDWL